MNALKKGLDIYIGTAVIQSKSKGIVPKKLFPIKL